MKKEKINIISCLIILIILVAGCKRKDIEFIGPKIPAPVGEGFQVINNVFNASDDAIDFTQGNLHFRGTFSSEAGWTITIRGLESGAVKKISDVSTGLTPENSAWTGGHDELMFFRTGETCVAEISFFGTTLTLSDTFIIQQAKVFDGLLVMDFEDKEAWPCYYYFAGNSKNPNERKQDGSLSVQGKYSFSQSGTDAINGYFVSGVRCEKSPGVGRYFELGTNEPKSIYFNVYVYGRGNPNTQLNITLAEDDDGNGIYKDASEDTWDFEVKVNWTGWKLVTARYSDFTPGKDPKFGGNGNKKQQPDKVKKITLGLLSSPPGKTVAINSDFLVVTFNKPFDPSE